MWTYNNDILKAMITRILPTLKYNSVSDVEPRGFLYFAFVKTCIHLEECSLCCHSCIFIVIFSWSIVFRERLKL